MHMIFLHEWCDSALACTYRHHKQCTVLQEGAARQTQTCHSKEKTRAVGIRHLVHHDNAPVHTARAVTDVLAGYKWKLMEHPRDSPDLALCDFHLFPKMKEHLRGQRFETERGHYSGYESSNKEPGQIFLRLCI
ncbi:mariner Mos1 transposase [Elysia marginata]|uniref:Mariner Mos1 transposase n=1 Tax=Elysia marginata TaxID=1093978 RepID=A0AAV4JYF8_9GAST|nr:mariner Mos1 transposase [Elysia marginata]